MPNDARDADLPAYSLGSVDKALRVIHMLRDENPLRVSSIARALGIGVSTAHRIMAMLVFHGFAVQDPKRQYLPGPALGAPVFMTQDVGRLRRIATPVVERLAADLDESVNLTLRVGPHARVLVTAGPLGRMTLDRLGAVFPAYATSAGRVALVDVTPDQLERYFRAPVAERAGTALDEGAFEDLKRELAQTRQRGYALTREGAVKGVSGIAVPVAAAKTHTITIAVLTVPSGLDPLLADDARMTAIRAAAAELGERLRIEE